MDAYSNDFQKMFLAKNPCDCQEIRSNQIAVLKALVSFKYQLKRLCNVSSWSVSLMYNLVIATMYQIGRMMMSQHGPRHSDLYRPKLGIAATSNAVWADIIFFVWTIFY